MIYIVDDKISRQRDYGWDNRKFAENSDYLCPIHSAQDLVSKKELILSSESVVLYHASFTAQVPASLRAEVECIEKELSSNSSKLITTFSGGGYIRKIEGKRCMLPVDVLYQNLEIFLKKHCCGQTDFRYLMYGEDFLVEERLANDIIKISEQNVDELQLNTEKSILFAEVDEYSVKCPFENATIDDEWGYDVLSDSDMDQVVRQWNETKYDLIYIPLCFGNSLSDFLGLRLAMHLRFTKGLNQTTPICIYGQADISLLQLNGCFDILKATGIKFSLCGLSQLAKVGGELVTSGDVSMDGMMRDMSIINLHMPANNGDNHSMANQWGANVIARLIGKQEQCASVEMIEKSKELYYKYVLWKTSSDSAIENRQESVSRVVRPVDASNKKILLIDDEASKGWESVLQELLPKAARFDVVREKLKNYDDLPEEYTERIKRGYYDLYLLDLRLRGEYENGVTDPKEFSGMKVLKGIKNNNEGNQVIMLTATNKAWNLKALLEEGADGYYLKESPEFCYPLKFSIENLKNLRSQIETAFRHSFRKKLFGDVEELLSYLCEKADQSIVNDDLYRRLSTLMEIARSQLMKCVKDANISSKVSRPTQHEKEFGYAFLSLFQVYECLCQEFIIANEITPRGTTWTVNHKSPLQYVSADRSINCRDVILNDHPSIRDRVVGIYHAMKKPAIKCDINVIKRIELTIDCRNAFVHDDKKKLATPEIKIIYDERGFEELLSALNDLFKAIC